MSNLETKARELADYLIEFGDPVNCTDNYCYYGSDEKSAQGQPVKKNCYGMTFKINMTEYPHVQEVQLTSLIRFFRTDLEVFIKLESGKKKHIEVLNFGGSFVSKWNEIVNKRILEERKKDEDKWLSSIDNILKER